MGVVGPNSRVCGVAGSGRGPLGSETYLGGLGRKGVVQWGKEPDSGEGWNGRIQATGIR